MIIRIFKTVDDDVTFNAIKYFNRTTCVGKS